jgi:hypothetical protein
VNKVFFSHLCQAIINFSKTIFSCRWQKAKKERKEKKTTTIYEDGIQHNISPEKCLSIACARGKRTKNTPPPPSPFCASPRHNDMKFRFDYVAHKFNGIIDLSLFLSLCNAAYGEW